MRALALLVLLGCSKPHPQQPAAAAKMDTFTIHGYLLAVERELARVRGEIESYEGRLRQWNDQIAMSTLTLSITTKAPAIAAATQPGLGNRTKSAFSDSVAALETFGEWLVVTGTTLLPWMILLVPGFVFGRRAYRRYAKKLPAAVASPRA